MKYYVRTYGCQMNVADSDEMGRHLSDRGFVATEDPNEGELFSEDNIEVKGPEKGLSAQYFFDIIGKKSPRKINNGEYLLDEDMS